MTKTKLIHDADLKIYAEYLDTPGEKQHNIIARTHAFYNWAQAKGYKTHRHLLKNSPCSVVKKKGVLYKPLTNYLGGRP